MIAKTDDLSATAEAKRIVNELLRLESRGNGDLEASMRRLANRYGLDWRVFWTLRYRNPKDIFVSVFRKLQEAHRVECERQIKRLRHEIEVARAAGVHVDDVADEVDALAAELEDCVAHNRNGQS